MTVTTRIVASTTLDFLKTISPTDPIWEAGGVEALVEQINGLATQKRHERNHGITRAMDTIRAEIDMLPDGELCIDLSPIDDAEASSLPQWTTIQNIRAGIDATHDKRVVVLAVDSAEGALRALKSGVGPPYGAAFGNGMQPAGSTSQDVIRTIRKAAVRVADKQKMFIIIARVEDSARIAPENIIGVTRLSTFSPTVVSIFGDKTATPAPAAGSTRAEVRKQVLGDQLLERYIQTPDEVDESGVDARDTFETLVDAETDRRMPHATPMSGAARWEIAPDPVVTGGAVGLRQFEPTTDPGLRTSAIGGFVEERPSWGGALITAMDPEERLAIRGTLNSARQKVLVEFGVTEEDVAGDPVLADEVAALVAIQLGNKAGDLTERDRMDQEQRDSDAQAIADVEIARVARTRLFPGQQVDRRIVARVSGIANANAAELDRTFQSLIDRGMLVPSKLVETRDGVISRQTGYVMSENSLDGLFEDNKVLVSAVPGAIGNDESFVRFGQMTLIGVVSNGTQVLVRTRDGRQLRIVLSRLQLQIDVPGAGVTSEDGAAVEWDNMPGMETWSDRDRAAYIKEAARRENPAITPSLVRNDRVVNPLRMRLLGGQPVDETIMANALGLDKDWRTEQLFQQMVSQGLFIRQPLQVQGGTTINFPSLPQYLVAFDAQDRSGPVLVRYTGNGLNVVMAYKGIDKSGNGEFDSTGGGKQQRYVFELNGKNIVLVDRSGKALDPDAMDPWRPPPAEPPDGPVGPPKPPDGRPPTSGGDASGGGNDIVLPEVAVTRKRWYDGITRAFGTSNNLRFTNMLSNPLSTMNEFITQTGNVLSLKAQAGMAAGLEERAGLSPSDRKMT